MGDSRRELRRTFGLHADDPHFRPQGFHRERNPGEQPRAADGDDDRVEIGDLFEDFEAHGALAGYDFWVVVAVDIGVAVLLGAGAGVALGFEEGRAVEDDVGPEALAGVDLHQGGDARHDDRHRNPEESAVIS